MLYSMEQEDRDRDDPAVHDINSEAFWTKLTSIFKQTREMIATMAAERGIDLESIEVDPAEEEKQDRLRDESESHPLSQSAKQYIKLVNEWFDREYPEADQDVNADQMPTDSLAIDFEAQDLASNIQDAMEVIRWYQFQIAVKIMRGLMHDPDDDDPEDTMQRDSDGSAKVALIGMERSISAWARLRELVPDKSSDIVQMMVHLEQLRRGTEQKFPMAMSFVRPGFDEAPDRFVS